MLIYEKNDIELSELHRGRGYYTSDPMTELFQMIILDADEKKLNSLILKYYINKIGISTEKMDSTLIQKIKSYLEGRIGNFGLRTYLRYDILTGLAYYLADKLFKLKPSGFGLSYFIDKEGDTRNFYFFDSAFKIFVGKIDVSKSHQKKLKGTIFDIGTSAAERKLIGMGYGLKMYMSILENCDYLTSSSVLYTGSFRIWSKVLPKYVNVWWKSSDSDSGKVKLDYVKIEPNEDFKISGNKIDFFVASMYHKKL